MADEKVALWRFSEVEVNVLARELRVGGQLVDIEPKPFDLLLQLLAHAGEVVTMDEMLESVWPGRVVSEATVTNTVGKVRKAIRDDQQQIITTISKTGYRLVAPVEKVVERRRPAAVLTLKAGDTIQGRPHWMLVEQLSPGGFGDVWMAKHAKTHERRVFKFCVEPVHLSALKREVTLFRVLRESLGERARIVSIFDWQFDEPPYYIESEYAGDNLRTWFNHQGGIAGVPMPRRIELTAKIAEAVGAAHSVGVLHKDLKAENILVVDVEGEPSVKLCDFGAGVVIDPGKVGNLGLTMLGFTHTVAHRASSGPGTLIYMAPELFSGEAPSVQSDVYALGVFLYQMISAQWRPIASGWETDIDDELLKADIADSTNGIPQRRLPSAQLLAQRLRTLEERRQKVDQERLQRARLVRAQQALERNRARLPWALALGAALVVGIVVSGSLWLRERRIAAFADEQRNVALQLNGFLSQDIVRAASPEYGGKYDISLKTAVSQSIPRIAQRFAGNPVVEAALDQSLADTLNSLSDPADATKLSLQSAKLYATQYGPGDSRSLSAELDAIGYQLSTGHVSAIQPQFDVAYKKLKLAVPAADPLMFKARMIEAKLALMDGRQVDAVQLLEKLLADYPKPGGGVDVRSLDLARTTYLKALTFLQRFQTIEDDVALWMPHYVSTYGPVARPTLELREYLGRAYSGSGGTRPDDAHFGKAEVEYRFAKDGYVALYGPDSAETLHSMENLADLYADYERWDDAIPLYKVIHAGYAKQFGEGSQWTLRPLIRLVYCLDQAQQPADAVEQARLLRGQAAQYLTKTDYLYRYVLAVSGKALLGADRVDEASQLIDELDQLLTDHPSDQDPQASAYLVYLKGIRAQQRHEFSAAQSFLSVSVPLLEKADGPDDVYTLDAKARLQAVTRHS